ncbi:hypothetical protein BpHYR1_022377 [Brachionus plicatilis]|uniref:Uncharacterized protein n=1 Tax=Brachionus plicatilis TaxID=10195 RepID=A0A3M7T443_BRAPC|nr:hypothetical protein BpHYR1_022377 [Brachionus plicatilis]
MGEGRISNLNTVDRIIFCVSTNVYVFINIRLAQKVYFEIFYFKNAKKNMWLTRSVEVYDIYIENHLIICMIGQQIFKQKIIIILYSVLALGFFLQIEIWKKNIKKSELKNNQYK